MIILTEAAGPSRIGRFMGIVGVPMLLAPILGPLIGGSLVAQSSWRWIFLVNLPVGLAAIVAAAAILPPDERRSRARLDWVGVLLLSSGLAAFVYGPAALGIGAIAPVEAFAATLFGLALVVGFIVHARRHEDALIDVRLFARNPVAASAATIFLIGGAFFGTSLVLPLYFQIAHAQTAAQAGRLLAAQGFGAMLAMPIAGKLTDKLGAGEIVLTGLAVWAAGILGLSQANSATPLWLIELAVFFIGLGSGSSLMPTISAGLAVLQRNAVPRATSGLNVILRAGGALGTALLAIALAHQLSRSALPHVTNTSHAASLPLATGPNEASAPVFLWVLAILVIAFAAAFFLPRERPRADGIDVSSADKIDVCAFQAIDVEVTL
jgi:EmrB/QacA subfamily drug resistance transporter